MKSLEDQGAQRELAARLKKIEASGTRRWGSMTAHQMVCHLDDSFKIVMGERPCGSRTNIFMRTAGRWIALHTPIGWPQGVETLPEADQRIGGTKPAEFARDMASMLRTMDRFMAANRDFAFAKHPIFGRLTDAECLVWGYRHVDHHLRQFGA